MLSEASILDKEDRILFSRFCEYMVANNSTQIDIEEVILDVIKWAERHNYGPMRLTQTVKKMIEQCIENLAKHFFCKLKKVEGEGVTGFEMIEPEVEIIRSAYGRMDKDLEQGFPTEKDLPLPLSPRLFISADDSQLGVDLLEKSVKEQKIVKLYFNEIDREILLEPKIFPQIVSICIKRIRKFMTSAGKIRILDDVAKSLEMVMPGKNVNADRIVRILDLEERESPVFFVHLAESLVNRIGEDKGRSDLMSIYFAAIILKRFKMEQETREEGKRKEELQTEDAKKLLSHMQRNPRTFTKADMLRFREGEGMKEHLEGTYDKSEFAALVDFFIQQYAGPGDVEAAPEDKIPMIILFHAEGKDLYIHREFIVSLLEKERSQAAHEVEKILRERWSNALRKYEKLPEMNNDTVLEDSIRKLIAEEFPLLFSLLSLREELFTVFQIYKSEPDISARFSFYFPKASKAEMRSLTALMEIKRQNLYRESYGALPYLYRFPVTRFILFLINLFTKKKKPQEENKEKEGEEGDDENSSMKTAEEAIQKRKELSGKLRKFLPDIEKKYRAGGTVQAALRDLQDRWNIKLGEVREILNEKVDRDIAEKALAIYKICLKSPHLSEEFLHQELKNMATNLVRHKYTDIHDKKALARYIMIRSIWVLHQKTR